MFVETMTPLTTAELVCKKRLRLSMAAGASFQVLVSVTNELRQKYVEVRMIGPYFLLETKEITLELIFAQDKVEIRMPASSVIVQQNSVLW